MELIRAKRTAGAEVNSYKRSPPPRCHPDTRNTARGAITSWFADPDRTTNMYWMLGSAGVGKSAIAQTIAEKAKADGVLGAAYFFSRPNHCDNALSVISTLAHQFAALLPQYKQLIIERLDHDHTILEHDLESQFRHLIAEPFNLMRTRQTFPYSLLVVIDGLDECNSPVDQCTFIRLISGCASASPVCWLVCSRPESHLKRLLPKADPSIRCICDDLLEEGKRDVYRFLVDKFAEIRSRFPDEVDEKWPAEAEIVKLAAASSGHFGFASTSVNFISSDYPGNPVAQLNVVLDLVRTSRVSGNVNPLEALDRLYHCIIKAIPSETLPVTFSILSLHSFLPEVFCTVSDDRRKPGHSILPDLANILMIPKGDLYSALRWLHSVLEVPDANVAHQQRLHVYHTSFLDFLRDPLRSQHVHEEILKGDLHVARKILKWNDILSKHDCIHGLFLS